MKNHTEIQQGTEDWFRMKWGKIGGTLSKGLFVDSDTLFIEILSQNLEDFTINEDTYVSLAMERGNELEPLARRYISAYTGIDFKQTGWLQSEECGLLGISPDGISECEKYACEIKCLGAKAHTELLVNNDITMDKTAQIIHYFTVNPKLENLFFIAYRPESLRHFIKEFNRESVVYLTKTKFDTIKNFSEIALKNAKDLESKILKTVEKIKGI